MSEEQQIELVKMFRGEQLADVHPNEVHDYECGGWQVYGPTFEEWIEAGYQPQHYPPAGYPAKLTTGFAAYQEAQKQPAPPAPQDPPAAPQAEPPAAANEPKAPTARPRKAPQS